jgi:hypothetical protein
MANFLLKLSYETQYSVVEGRGIIFNSFLNILLWNYCSSFPVIKANTMSNHNSWITTGIHTLCKHKRELYSEFRNIKILTSRKYFKHYCQPYQWL